VVGVAFFVSVSRSKVRKIRKKVVMLLSLNVISSTHFWVRQPHNFLTCQLFNFTSPSTSLSNREGAVLRFLALLFALPLHPTIIAQQYRREYYNLLTYYPFNFPPPSKL
jgi:hypothetical protein